MSSHGRPPHGHLVSPSQEFSWLVKHPYS